jgi:serine/threonine-protein kinase RsbW
VNPTSSPVEGVVEIRLPAEASFVATVRLAAASLAARCDLTVDDIEDLRLAVDEACSLLLQHAAPDSTLDTRFELNQGSLRVETSVLGELNNVDRSGFAWTVLEALTSTVDVATGDGRMTVTLTKRRDNAGK